MAFVVKNNNKRGVYIEVLLILETIVIHQIKPYCCLVDYKSEYKKCVYGFFTLTLHPCIACMTTVRERYFNDMGKTGEFLCDAEYRLIYFDNFW